jgi:hypothetical protein
MRDQRDRDAAAVMAGQVVYTRRTLDLYDLVVLGLSNALIWKCPTKRLLDHYNKHVAAKHLDVGVGTGWFLDHCRFPTDRPDITLLDLNPVCLERASARIERYTPKIVRANVLEPVELKTGPFESMGLNYLLHCLPGALEQKAVVFDHLKPFLTSGGVVFGSTLLAEGVGRSGSAQALMRFYNAKGIFSNQQDSFEGLRRELASRFEQVRMEIVGCAVLFAAR